MMQDFTTVKITKHDSVVFDGSLEDFELSFGIVEHTADIYEWAENFGYDVEIEKQTLH